MSALQVRGAVPAPRKPFYAKLCAQTLAAIALGVALGHSYPGLGESLRPSVMPSSSSSRLSSS